MEAETTQGRPVVRPMALEEVGIRIDYFHGASDEYLAHLGVDVNAAPNRTLQRAGFRYLFTEDAVVGSAGEET